VTSAHVCPYCQSKLKHHIREEGKLGAAYNYWACPDRDCGTRLEDLDGEPNFKSFSTNVVSDLLCPDCGTALRHLKREGMGKDAYNYWKCPDPNCGNIFDDLNNSPDFKSKRKSAISENLCPECGAKLIHRLKESTPMDPGYNYWSCQNRDCRASYPDLDGVPSKEKRAQATLSSEHLCPECGKPLRHIIKAPTDLNPGYNFWGCSGFPNCKVTFQDDNGKPGPRSDAQGELSTEHVCPECGKPLRHKFMAPTDLNPGYNFWGCSGFPECRVTFQDEDGKPGPRSGGSIGELSSEHMCPECGKPLRHKFKQGDEATFGYDFWGCSGFPNCRVTLQNIDGKPDYTSHKKDAPSGFKCFKCQGDLIRKKGVSSKTGYDYDFFACSNPNCRATFDAVDDKPLERR
jgi:ssDNA-binding Zn-finger/Zn-ribbon topoisomerase 1